MTSPQGSSLAQPSINTIKTMQKHMARSFPSSCVGGSLAKGQFDLGRSPPSTPPHPPSTPLPW